MKRVPLTFVLTAIIVLLAAGLIGTLLFVASQPAPTRGIAPLVTVADQEPDSEVWGQNFPNQYTTLLQTGTNRIKTAYGGSDPYSKLEDDPRLVARRQSRADLERPDGREATQMIVVAQPRKHRDAEQALAAYRSIAP